MTIKRENENQYKKSEYSFNTESIHQFYRITFYQSAAVSGNSDTWQLAKLILDHVIPNCNTSGSGHIVCSQTVHVHATLQTNQFYLIFPT